MTPEEQKHVDTFSEHLITVGTRIGRFLHDCIDEGIDITSPKTERALSLTANELMLVSEAIEQCLYTLRLKSLGWELSTSKAKSSNVSGP
jgi:hypothetical protein